MEEKIYQKYKQIADSHKLTNYEKRKLWGIIAPICTHSEFIKRCKPPFFHHDLITLGDHIIADTVLTYKMICKFEKKSSTRLINKKVAVYIAMFHDLYEKPWQNSFQKKKFKNLHGFMHPIEAAVNAITWYPEYFKNKEQALMIIDGIIHHMYPVPVRSLDGSNLELNNQTKYAKLASRYKEMIIASTMTGKIGSYSLRKSFFIEGRILSRADKIVAIKKELAVTNYLTLLTGSNKKLEQYNK